MITDAFFALLGGLLKIVSALLALPSPPGFVADLPAHVAVAGGYVGSTGAWFPWSLISAVFAAVALAWGAALTVKLVRIVASFATAGGGSAA